MSEWQESYNKRNNSTIHGVLANTTSMIKIIHAEHQNEQTVNGYFSGI